MANYRFPMLLALSISAAGALALTARPVISQTPTPALKSDCLTDLAHVEEAIEAERAKWFHAIEGRSVLPRTLDDVVDRLWYLQSKVNPGAMRERLAARLELTGKTCDEELPKGRAELRKRMQETAEALENAISRASK